MSKEQKSQTPVSARDFMLRFLCFLGICTNEYWVEENVRVLTVKYPKVKFSLGIVFISWPSRLTSKFAMENVAKFVKAQKSPLYGEGEWVEILVLESKSRKSESEMQKIAHHIELVGKHAIDVILNFTRIGERYRVSPPIATQDIGQKFLKNRTRISEVTLKERVKKLETMLRELNQQLSLKLEGFSTRLQELDSRITHTPYSLEIYYGGQSHKKALICNRLYEIRVISKEKPSGTYNQPDFFTPKNIDFVLKGHEWIGEVTPKREFSFSQIRRRNKIRLKFGTDSTPWESEIVIRRETLDIGLAILSAILAGVSITGLFGPMIGVLGPLPIEWQFGVGIAFVIIFIIFGLKWTR